MYIVMFTYKLNSDYYIFKTKKEMFDYFEVNNIHDILVINTSNICVCSIYKVSKEYSLFGGDYGI